MYTIRIRHNFETAHRLSEPGSPVKCMSIHGHSWWVTAIIEGPALGADGLLVEFGAFKSAWRRWLDDTLDHHLVLRQDDPMAPAIRGVDPNARLLLLPCNPTTEELAAWIWSRTAEILTTVAPPGIEVRLRSIELVETNVNAATFEAPAVRTSS